MDVTDKVAIVTGGGRGMGLGDGRVERMQIWAKIELAAGPAQ